MFDPSIWLAIKRDLVELTALDRDALHIYLGVAIQLLSAAVLRLRLSDWRSLLPLFVLELANEAVDLTYEIWPERMMQWSASAHDLVNTLVIPITILLIARRFDRPSSPSA